MKIYHYTSLENLALILKHKTIRFNRLDRMDDPCEKEFLVNQLDWSPYTYVSCWTENPIENLPFWHMYTDMGKGVRIGIDRDFIDWEKQSIAFSVASRQHQQKSMTKDSSGAISVTFNPTRIHRPLSDEVCYRKVRYASDSEYLEYENKIGKIARFMEIDEEIMRDYVGVFRKNIWAFQEETRFIIYAVPYTSTDAVVSHNDFINLIRLNMPNNVPFIDVPIKHWKLKDLEVTLGPNVSEGQGILAKTLLNKYAPEAQLKFSVLSDSSIWFLL
ncbi:MAG: hypothetical protein K2K75_02815 [Muribaculaceae bacterium]|nr:hypothetical protein [Muribaculaceae bacterium]